MNITEQRGKVNIRVSIAKPVESPSSYPQTTDRIIKGNQSPTAVAPTVGSHCPLPNQTPFNKLYASRLPFEGSASRSGLRTAGNSNSSLTHWLQRAGKVNIQGQEREMGMVCARVCARLCVLVRVFVWLCVCVNCMASHAVQREQSQIVPSPPWAPRFTLKSPDPIQQSPVAARAPYTKRCP